MNRVRPARFHHHQLPRRIVGLIFGTVCLAATCAGVVVLALLLGSILVAALQGPPDHAWYAIGPNAKEVIDLVRKLADEPRKAPGHVPEEGYRVAIAGSLWLLGLVALIGIPVGVGAGIFLEEYATRGRLRRIIQTNVANLAGVPSIVYGILGLALFVHAFGIKGMALGPTLLAGALTLSLLILPIIVVTTQEALRAVPQSLRHAALAIGATRWQMVRDHVLPAALPGILTGTILGLSRAIGETAPLIMVHAAGKILDFPKGPQQRYTALPVAIYNYAKAPQREFRVIAAGGILILLALLLAMNAAAIVIRNRSRRSY
jgi:phosphate transport system permease protein